MLVLHAASSTTNPCNYAHLLRNVVHPYWSADPPEHRLSNKAYKSVDHPTAFVPETSLVFKARSPFAGACAWLAPPAAHLSALPPAVVHVSAVHVSARLVPPHQLPRRRCK